MGEERLAKVSWGKSLRALWFFLAPEKATFILLGVLGLLSAGANALVPLISGRFFDALSGASIGTSTVSSVLVVFGGWFCVQLVANAVDWYREDAFDRLDDVVRLQIQQGAFAQLLRLPVSYHKNEKVAAATDTISKASWMGPTTARTFLNVFPQLLSVVIGIGIAFQLHPGLALLLVAGACVYTALAWRTIRVAPDLYHRWQKEWSDAWQDAYAAVEHVHAVKAFATEEYESEKSRRAYYGRVLPMSISLRGLWNALNLYQRIIVLTVQATVFLASVQLVLAGSLTVGELIAFNGYALMFLGPLVYMGQMWDVVQNGMVSVLRLKEKVYDPVPETYVPQDAQSLGALRGEVELRDVTFSYPDSTTTALEGVSFTVRAGHTVALVGESGGGKSTLIALLLAHYFPQEGQVLIDGIESTKLNLHEFRSQIAMVPQEVALFNDTIRMNLMYGSFTATEEQVIAAAKAAQAHDFIANMPKGYDTMVGERGVKLSVGQKQRIAVARAILRDPKILVLDEPTSALDAETEHAMTAALETLMKGRTTFIIAHRLSTVRKADTIVVLKDKRVAEIGSHEELVRQGGVYAHLYRAHVGLHE